MHHYGIIGYPLEHSHSAKYFNEKFKTSGIDAEYSLYPIEVIDGRTEIQIRELLDTLDGINITFPYKQRIIPYLERLDETAATIGAVNVVHNHVGYNTDCIGFMQTIHPLLRDFDNQALVLGTGGASKAVSYGLRQLGIRPTLVSRMPKEGMLSYADITEEVMKRHSLIINCTPLGMLPDTESCPPIPYTFITARHLLFDCIYNPEETLFLRKGKAQGATIQNGLEMLTGQAQAAWDIWNKK